MCKVSFSILIMLLLFCNIIAKEAAKKKVESNAGKCKDDVEEVNARKECITTILNKKNPSQKDIESSIETTKVNECTMKKLGIIDETGKYQTEKHKEIVYRCGYDEQDTAVQCNYIDQCAREQNNDPNESYKCAVEKIKKYCQESNSQTNQ